MEAKSFLSAASRRRFGINVSFMALVLWSFCFSFSQVAGPRYLSICLFTCLGGVLLWLSASGSPILPQKSETGLFWLLFLLGILPLSDVLLGRASKGTWTALQLHIPMIALPLIVVQLRRFWPFFWQKIFFLAMLAGLVLSQLTYLSQGPLYIWESLRSDREFLLSGFLNRPYFGFLGGLTVLMAAHFWRKSLPGLFYLVLVFECLFLVLIGAKLSVLALFCSFLLGIYWYFFKNRWVKLGLPLVLFLGSLVGVYLFFHSIFWYEIQHFGSIRFETLPKFLINSFNTRLILWQASFQVLAEGNWLLGLGSHQFQEVLDQKLLNLNGYVASQHLNPHNVWLYIWLQYGLPGVLLLVYFFYCLLNQVIAQKEAGLALVLLFWFLALQTEVLYDRELGVHVWVWIVLVLFSADANEEAISPQVMPPFFQSKW